MGQGRHTPAVRKQQTGDQQESDSRTNRQTDRQMEVRLSRLTPADERFKRSLTV